MLYICEVGDEFEIDENEVFYFRNAIREDTPENGYEILIVENNTKSALVQSFIFFASKIYLKIGGPKHVKAGVNLNSFTITNT